MRTFDAVIPYLKKSWFKLSLGVIVLIVVDALQLIMPLVIKGAIDGLSKEGYGQKDLVIAGIIIIILALGMIILRYLWRMLISANAYVIELGLRKKFYNHLMKLSQNYFNFAKIGDLMALATNDLNSVRMLFGMGLIAGVDIIFLATASFLFMIYINLELTLISITPMVFIPLFMYYFGKRLHNRFKAVQESFAKLSGMIQESISGIRIVKAFTQEKAELNKMQVFSEDFVDENIKMAKLSGIFHPLNGVVISISMIFILVYGGRSVILGDISIGDFIAFFSYLGMLIWPMFAIGWIVDMYQRGSASIKRLNAVWETQPEIADNENTNHDITEIQGNLEIKDLSFSYKAPLPKTDNEDDSLYKQNTLSRQQDFLMPHIFHNINTGIKAGKTLAICGRTGSGKSTIIDLICRVYNPDKGTIFIDGFDITTIPIKLLRESIVMVPQDIFLFSDTIANNIALGKPESKNYEIENAAKTAAVYDDIMEFTDGFNTIIGERGVTVSGGQKQRIAIARALLTDPKILILDDALSAVDTKTEKDILKNLIEARNKKTNIIIAHRISALSHADKIIVLNDNKISEAGTHIELLAINGLYRELYEKQKIEEKIES